MSARAQALNRRANELARTISHIADLDGHDLSLKAIGDIVGAIQEELAAPPVGVSPQPGDSPPDMGHGWFVTVGRSGDSVVTIEEKCLSGKPDFTPQDDALIRGAARHLLAFIGSPASLSPVEPTPEIKHGKEIQIDGRPTDSGSSVPLSVTGLNQPGCVTEISPRLAARGADAAEKGGDEVEPTPEPPYDQPGERTEHYAPDLVLDDEDRELLGSVEPAPPTPDAQVCVWREGEWDYESGCRGTQISRDERSSGPPDGWKHCPYCGKRLEVGTAPQGGEQ